MVKVADAYLVQTGEETQLVELLYHGIAAEGSVEARHSLCLVYLQLAIAVLVPVFQADSLHFGIGKNDMRFHQRAQRLPFYAVIHADIYVFLHEDISQRRTALQGTDALVGGGQHSLEHHGLQHWAVV